jgi:hypothetical protein
VAEREGTVFIAEETDAREPYWFSGRFSAHWEHRRRHRDGPMGVPADEAIVWGRKQADQVLIRLVDSDYYSAGAKPVEDLEPWPEGTVVEPRRQPGMEHLDLVAREPVAWEVRLPYWISRRRTETDLADLCAAVEADPAASEVRVEVERGERVEAILGFAVRARTHAEALEVVLAIERRAREEVPYPGDELPAGDGPFVIPMGWNPWDDIRPALA